MKKQNILLLVHRSQEFLVENINDFCISLNSRRLSPSWLRNEMANCGFLNNILMRFYSFLLRETFIWVLLFFSLRCASHLLIITGHLWKKSVNFYKFSLFFLLTKKLVLCSLWLMSQQMEWKIRTQWYYQDREEEIYNL